MGIRSLLILRVGATQSLANENDEIKASGELRRWIYDYDVVEALKDQMDHS